MKTCADKEWMIPRAPIGRRSPVAPPCDPAQPQRPCRCSLIHSREQLVYKSSASLCLWCCYAEIRFFYCSKRSVIAIRVCISSQKDIKGRWSILVILWRVPPGGNQLHLMGKRDSWSSPFPYRPSSACVVFFFFFLPLPVWNCFHLNYSVLYHCVWGRVQVAWKLKWKAAAVFRHDAAAASLKSLNLWLWRWCGEKLLSDSAVRAGNEGATHGWKTI